MERGWRHEVRWRWAPRVDIAVISELGDVELDLTDIIDHQQLSTFTVYPSRSDSVFHDEACQVSVEDSDGLGLVIGALADRQVLDEAQQRDGHDRAQKWIHRARNDHLWVFGRGIGHVWRPGGGCLVLFAGGWDGNGGSLLEC